MGETSTAPRAARKRDGVVSRIMLRFSPEAACGVERVMEELGLDSMATASRLLVHEALKARGMDRETLKRMLEEKTKGIPVQVGS